MTKCSLSPRPVCKAARADLVFLVDGSWSIGDDNFLKIIRFLYSTAGALDQIGPEGTQVPGGGDREHFDLIQIILDPMFGPDLETWNK